MTNWAVKIGGYFPADMVYTAKAFEIEEYKTVDTRVWHGGNADLEIYTLLEEGHGINVVRCTTLMWEFMSAHPMDQETVNCFVTSETHEIVAQCGEKIEFGINYTDGAELTVTGEPKGWNYRLNGKTVSMTGPVDFFGDIDRKGEMILTVSIGGQTAKDTISYELKAPKEYFEVGDIYYNDDFEPVGVVCWVNNANIKEAKIINLEGPNSYGNVWYGEGLGNDFETPDQYDGEGNTAKMIARKEALNLSLSAANSAFVWAAEYSYKGVSGWYLPAVKELEAIASNVAVIQEKMKELGVYTTNWDFSAKTLYSSTTETGGKGKLFYNYNYSTKQVGYGDSADEYLGYIYARAFKKVSK